MFKPSEDNHPTLANVLQSKGDNLTFRTSTKKDSIIIDNDSGKFDAPQGIYSNGQRVATIAETGDLIASQQEKILRLEEKISLLEKKIGDLITSQQEKISLLEKSSIERHKNILIPLGILQKSVGSLIQIENEPYKTIFWRGREYGGSSAEECPIKIDGGHPEIAEVSLQSRFLSRTRTYCSIFVTFLRVGRISTIGCILSKNIFFPRANMEAISGSYIFSAMSVPGLGQLGCRELTVKDKGANIALLIDTNAALNEIAHYKIEVIVDCLY